MPPILITFPLPYLSIMIWNYDRIDENHDYFGCLDAPDQGAARSSAIEPGFHFLNIITSTVSAPARQSPSSLGRPSLAAGHLSSPEVTILEVLRRQRQSAPSRNNFGGRLTGKATAELGGRSRATKRDKNIPNL